MTSGVYIRKKPIWNKGKEYPAIRGEKNGNWNGGKYLNNKGKFKRWYILNPNHPFVNKNRYILRSRLVMEEIIGRYLKPEEVIHHIDGDTTNDDPKNLMLFPNQQSHLRYR